MFEKQDMIQKMKWRASYPCGEGRYEDYLDGQHYARLREQFVTIDNETLLHHFFEFLMDLALAMSTDGFGPFKRRKLSFWPLIIYNLNLPPELRFLLPYILCVGLVPGAPKDFDSFLIPLVHELLMLARSVAAFDVSTGRSFDLCAYLILIFGDMPTIAKVMNMKGHNGLRPCCACHISGIRNVGQPRATTHYTPLRRNAGDSYDSLHLSLRTHDEFMVQASQVVTATTTTESQHRSQQFGIQGLPILSQLSSISFLDSFPHDFMHLQLENVVQ